MLWHTHVRERHSHCAHEVSFYCNENVRWELKEKLTFNTLFFSQTPPQASRQSVDSIFVSLWCIVKPLVAKLLWAAAVQTIHMRKTSLKRHYLFDRVIIIQQVGKFPFNFSHKIYFPPLIQSTTFFSVKHSKISRVNYQRS